MIKRICIVMLIINLLLVSGFSYKPTGQKTLGRNSVAAIAMDSKSKMVLFEKNAKNPIPMASTTKIMTALVAIKYGDLDSKVVISEKAARIHGSTVGYKKGEEISIRELIYGLMLRSGNDAAIALSEGISGSVEGFVKLMNEYAMMLGLVNTHFESPHGLDSQYHYTTAYELALITAKAKEYKVFNDVVGCKAITKDVYKFSRDYININKILHQLKTANGVKTGYTGNAGKCLVSSVSVENNDVVIVVLNCTPRWEETTEIYNYVAKNYQYKKLFSAGDIVSENKIGKKTYNLATEKDIILPVKAGENPEVEVKLPKKAYNKEVDDNHGTLMIKIKDHIFSQPLKVKEVS